MWTHARHPGMFGVAGKLRDVSERCCFVGSTDLCRHFRIVVLTQPHSHRPLIRRPGDVRQEHHGPRPPDLLLS